MGKLPTLKFHEVVNDQETVSIIQEALFQKAGTHGTLTGYFHQDEEEDYLVDFWTAYDSKGNEIDDTPLGELVSDDYYIPMIEIAIAQPDLLERDLEISF